MGKTLKHNILAIKGLNKMGVAEYPSGLSIATSKALLIGAFLGYWVRSTATEKNYLVKQF